MVYHSNLRGAFNRVAEPPENYMLVATQPLQSFPCLGALDVTAQLIPRDDSDRDASQRPSSLGWAFARESPIATVIVRKDCQVPVDSRAAMLVAQRLLRTATPPAASVLRPTGSVPDVALVKPTKMAEGRITAAVVKAKLHILACDQPWAYGAIANSNAGNTDQATYTIPQSLDTNVAVLWADVFRTASGVAGTPVDAIVHDDHSPSPPCRSTPGRRSTPTRSKTPSLTSMPNAPRRWASTASRWSSRRPMSPMPRRPTSGAPLRRATTSRRSSGGAARSRPAMTRFPGTLRPSLLPLSLRLALTAARTRSRSPPPRRRPRGLKVLPTYPNDRARERDRKRLH